MRRFDARCRLIGEPWYISIGEQETIRDDLAFEGLSAIWNRRSIDRPQLTNTSLSKSPAGIGTSQIRSPDRFVPSMLSATLTPPPFASGDDFKQVLQVEGLGSIQDGLRVLLGGVAVDEVALCGPSIASR